MKKENTQALVLLKQMHPSWHEFMTNTLSAEMFDRIWTTIRIDQFKLCPKPSQIFRILTMPIEDIKVIIVGQDPYINGEAEGLAFSSCKGMTPSLRSIFKEIALTEGKFRTNPSLLDWTKQGVFLINTNLTTIEHRSLAHDNVNWQWVTGGILSEISAKKQTPFVVMAWGNHAKLTVRQTIAKQDNRLILQHVHPAARFQEFTGCGHFKSANEFLVQHNLEPIDWIGKESTTVS